jgi:hypothetical protein
MNKELIIAAYDRDYDWISKINSDVRVTIYNKKLSNLKSGEIYLSPNVGRDVHTFFLHIVNNYNSLSDYTIFSQDYPFDHVDNYIELINGELEDWNKNAKQMYDGCWFFCTQYPVLYCDKDGSPNHVGLPIESIWKKLFYDEMPEIIEFTPTGHFCISKEAIKRLPISFYEKIIKILEENYDSPWVIERLEPYIFLNMIKKGHKI